ncbi:hypothetical protein LC55x_4926 [Lysobacter capsici]|nr:hypothetical protein LC55x_4926 [Lysobacter capsici]
MKTIVAADRARQGGRADDGMLPRRRPWGVRETQETSTESGKRDAGRSRGARSAMNGGERRPGGAV